MLKLATTCTGGQLLGAGGHTPAVVVDTEIHLPREQARTVLFRGQFAAVTEAAALDMSVVGRDILNLFAVILDRPGDVVCLLGQNHRYKIESD